MHIPSLLEIGGIILVTLGISITLSGPLGDQVLAQNASYQEGLIYLGSNDAHENYANNFNEHSEILTVVEQQTAISRPAPVSHPGQPRHSVVFALPLRDDGRIWFGKVTFTASKPIEVEVLHQYEPKEEVDTVHGEPYHAILPGNKSIAITDLRNIVNVPIEINGTGISSGTLEFVGSALVSHKTIGQPFTVTYSIDAVAKPTINQN
jgi:hypothetical protein